jgi:hypothetical protein
MRDPNPRHAVPDPEGTGECKEPLSVSYTKDDHREADANADYRDQDRHNAGGKGEVREIALQRRGLRFDHRPEVPRRTGPLRMELSIRQLQAAGRFRFDNYKTDVDFLFPRTVSAILGHRLLNTISQDFPRGNLVTLYASDVHFYRITLGLILRSSQEGDTSIGIHDNSSRTLVKSFFGGLFPCLPLLLLCRSSHSIFRPRNIGEWTLPSFDCFKDKHPHHPRECAVFPLCLGADLRHQFTFQTDSDHAGLILILYHARKVSILLY